MNQSFLFFRLALLFCAIATLPASAESKNGVIQCANLIYAGTQTSRCFSDEFLSSIQKKTSVVTERRFKPVKLGSNDLFQFPFVVMTGESSFRLSDGERENMKRYLSNGGFLLASAGCSSKDWNKSFRMEMKSILPDAPLKSIPFEHPIYQTVYQIKKLTLSHGGTEKATLEGIEINGRIVAVYSSEGLNDTAHNKGCCCCGGNEVQNSLEVNVNILAYALMH